jgi:hypothetical protein
MAESLKTTGIPELRQHDHLLRHIIGIVVPIHLSKPNRELSGRMADAEIATGIVVSISEQWFLVSAGHLVNEVRDRHERGDTIMTCRLITLANPEREMPSIQLGLFDPDSSSFFNPNLMAVSIHKGGLDCLIVAVSESLRDLLEHRGVQALDESTWRQPSDCPKIHFITGFPSHLAELDEQQEREQNYVGLQLTVPIIPVYPTNDPPANLKKPIERLFFQLPRITGHANGVPKQFDHPGGLSGGPIFGATAVNETEIRHCLLGIQSSWDKDSRVIAATPWPFVVEFIVQWIEKWMRCFESSAIIGR